MDGERRKKSRGKKAAATAGTVLWLERRDGSWQRVPAELQDIGEYGLGVTLGESLLEGRDVLVESAEVAGAGGGRARGRIAWCTPVGPGQFRAGVALEDGRGVLVGKEEEFEDFYETLEVNPSASFDTIHKVYRLLAQRVHPDHPESGNEEAFKKLVRAFGILSDPEKRAEFDAQRSRSMGKRWRIFDPENAVPGLEQEQRKRKAIFALLYTKRLRQPEQPGVSIQEMEQLLAVPREHLEFPLWYMKEQGWLLRTDGGRHQITAKGVEYAESTGAWKAPLARNSGLLPAARPTGT